LSCRLLLVVLSFEGNGAEVAEEGVEPLPVVEDLQVFEDGGSHFGPALPRGLVDESEFERREVALDPSVDAPISVKRLFWSSHLESPIDPIEGGA